MYTQTISLFRYLLLGIITRRLILLLGVFYACGLLSAGLIMELTIINSQPVAIAFFSDFIRYVLVILMVLLITSNVASDFEYRQFERLLTMPVSRWQFIVAEFLVILATAFALVLPMLLILAFVTEPGQAAYWVTAVWFELILFGTAGLLAILSLEKIPLAVIFTLAVYLLSKLSGLISLMLAESVKLSDGSLANRFVEAIFSGILYLLPSLETFASNDVFFGSLSLTASLAAQFRSVFVYTLLLVCACLVDFYRKEFNA